MNDDRMVVIDPALACRWGLSVVKFVVYVLRMLCESPSPLHVTALVNTGPPTATAITTESARLLLLVPTEAT